MNRHISQEVRPWNEKFSLPLRKDAFRPRAAIAGKDARTLAREVLAMSDEDFRTAFKRPPMKRAKLRGLQRNAATWLGNIANRDDMSVLMAALDHPEQVVRDCASWAWTASALTDLR